jgi:RNA polymerase sigma factor (sigma-70 family)
MSPDDIEELYLAHARRIAGYLMRATGDAEVAADLTAETFAAALLARDRYRSDLGAPTTWLYAIAANKLKDWRRRGYAEDRARRRLLCSRSFRPTSARRFAHACSTTARMARSRWRRASQRPPSDKG